MNNELRVVAPRSPAIGSSPRGTSPNFACNRGGARKWQFLADNHTIRTGSFVVFETLSGNTDFVEVWGVIKVWK